MKNKTAQILLVVLLLILLLLLTDPFMLWMPPLAGMMVLLVATVGVVVWAGFVAMERASDERELAHRTGAGRVSYLLGLTTLVVALVVQGLSHNIDPWIVATLAVMIVSRLITRLYFESRY